MSKAKPFLPSYFVFQVCSLTGSGVRTRVYDRLSHCGMLSRALWCDGHTGQDIKSPQCSAPTNPVTYTEGRKTHSLEGIRGQ